MMADDVMVVLHSRAAQEAYEILHDESRRREYDEMRRTTQQQSHQSQRGRGTTQSAPGTKHYDPDIHGKQYQTQYTRDSDFYAFGRGVRSHWEEMRETEEEEMDRIEREWERMRRRARFGKQFEVRGWRDDPDDRDFVENPHLRVARMVFICGVAMFVSRLVIGKGAYDPRYNRDQFRFVDGRLWRVSQLEKGETLKR